ncbi:head GIN domain-containing protein [Methylococcus sp. EFPC2]|uniref:head GIN domain-containing protein n=1 Tax=Methylococcus sp. EFPC2 TaxID=2812648 RepID=UPI001967C9AD|nr:head GIN domain-containing protein [Methylococcus sp. EFPC2]QSA97467.1 DUF2807 domain-containing protein [Methylococcus sp. EFPC2]
MRTLINVGLALLASAAVLVAITYVTLRINGPAPGAAGNGWTTTFSTRSEDQGSEARTITPEVVKLELDGPVELTLKQGPVPALTVRTDKSWLQRVVSEQEGDRLRLGYRGREGWHIYLGSTPTVRAELVLPALEELVSKGSGDFDVSGFSGERLNLVLKGSGDLSFNGQYRQIFAKLAGSGDMKLDARDAENLDVELHGSGDITTRGHSRTLKAELKGSGSLHAQHLEADAVELALSGSGDVTVYARLSVDVRLNGSGSVDIYGDPAQRNSRVNGSGKVSWK